MGDSKIGVGGGYFFSHGEYNGFARSVVNALKDEKVLLYISLNESNVDWLDETLPTCKLRGSSPAEDLYALSLCDYIIGPPSSFSRWASLMGHVPIYQIWDKNEEIREDSFSPLLFLDEREDGLKYP